MDTLPQDLINLITDLSRTSDSLLLGLETSDNQPYLKLVTLKARLKLALKENNAGWVHQIAKYVSRCYSGNVNSRFIDELRIKNQSKNLRTMDILRIVPLLGYYGQVHNHYLHGKRCDQSILKPDTDLLCKKEFIKGLVKGQHYELFDQHAEHPSDLSYIVNFNNEDYIINKLNSMVKSDDRFGAFFCMAMRLKRFKVVKYLLDRHKKKISRINSCISAYLIHTNQYNGEKYDSIAELKYVIYKACLDSNYKALDYIYNNSNKRSFQTILSTSLITKELEQYAYEKFKLRTKNNDILIKSVSLLMIHIDQCDHFEGSAYSVEHTSGIFQFIMELLINHYIKMNDMVGLRAIYTIIMESELLPIFYSYSDVVFLSTHSSYQEMQMIELRRTVEDRGIKNPDDMSKSQLILALMDGCS